MKNFIIAFIIIFVLVTPGCQGLSRKTEKFISKLLIPVNIVVGYFGSIATHEGGHAGAAWGIGGHDVNVIVIPMRDDEGRRHFGFTTTVFDEEPSDLELTLFHTMGPTAMWVGHVGSRALLRAGKVPHLLQPTLAWYSVCNQIGFYGGTLFGLARLDQTDLGKEDVWISAVMLLGGLTIDLVDFLSDEPKRYFGVLVGESFYERGEDGSLKFMAIPQSGGGFLGLRYRW